MRRECFARIGLFDESMPMAEDVDLLFRLEAAGIRCAPVPKVLIDIHIHSGTSLSRNEDWSRFVDSYRILVAKNKSLLDRYPLLWQHYHDSLAGHLYRIGDHRAARQLIWQIFRHSPWQLAGLSKFLRFELKRLKF
jgi:GT2 family glycosyltransferase